MEMSGEEAVSESTHFDETLARFKSKTTPIHKMKLLAEFGVKIGLDD